MNSEEKKKKLEEEIGESRSPRQKISLMNDLAMELHYSDPSASLQVTKEALKLAKEINFVPGIARSHFSAGMAFFKQAEYLEAFDAFHQALQEFRTAHDRWGESNALNNIGLIHQRLGDFSRALEFYSDSLKVKEDAGDQFGKANVLISMAGIYRETKNFDEAKRIIDEVLKASHQLNAEALIGKALMECGLILSEQKSFTDASEIFSKALISFSKQNHQTGIAQCLLESGKINVSTGDVAAAVSSFENSLSVAEQIGDKHLIMLIQYEMAQLEMRTGHLQQSANHLFIAKEIAEQTRQKPVLMKVHDALSRLYETEKDFDRALFHLKKSFGLSAEITVAEATSKLRSMEISRRVESLEKEKKMLEVEKMAALGQLTAGVAHEINNPVNFVAANISPVKRNIQDILSVLRRCEEIINEFSTEENKQELRRLREEFDLDYTIDEINRLLSGIESGASRISEIVNGLRTFTRHEEEEYKPADIHEGINAALLLLSGRIKSGIRIEKDFGEVVPFEHYPGLLNQAVMHLILNAVEAIETEGIVSIKTRAENNFVIIQVSDTGKGMNEELKRKIFDPFFTTKNVGAGTGLGLSITKGIIDKHHGTIEIESNKGKGTTVKLILPNQKSA